MTLSTRLSELSATALAAIAAANSPEDLERVRVDVLGRKGTLAQISKEMGKVPPEQRGPVGKLLNAVKQELDAALETKSGEFANAALRARLDAEWMDLTLPAPGLRPGSLHPITQIQAEIEDLFVSMGFTVLDGPEVESEYYNFDALNTPAWHPARDLHDTFYVGQGQLLRTHTTAFQGRVMRASGGKTPIRAMTTGRCYRADDIDASHYPIFQQLDVFAVGGKLSMADLRWTLTELAKGLFGPEAQLRFRPSYFPFTTPSAEVDVSCMVCRQNGCALCSRTGWLEVLGSGMMRPEVLKAGGLDPAKHQGFAFGIGVDRITMLRHQINDIRLLYDNEEAFLRQF